MNSSAATSIGAAPPDTAESMASNPSFARSLESTSLSASVAASVSTRPSGVPAMVAFAFFRPAATAHRARAPLMPDSAASVVSTLP